VVLTQFVSWPTQAGAGRRRRGTLGRLPRRAARRLRTSSGAGKPRGHDRAARCWSCVPIIRSRNRGETPWRQAVGRTEHAGEVRLVAKPALSATSASGRPCFSAQHACRAAVGRSSDTDWWRTPRGTGAQRVPAQPVSCSTSDDETTRRSASRNSFAKRSALASRCLVVRSAGNELSAVRSASAICTMSASR